MRTLARLMAALVVTGAFAVGGAALADAATASNTAPPSTTTTTTPTNAPATVPSKPNPPSGKHHCPGMSGSSRSGANYAPGPSQPSGV